MKYTAEEIQTMKRGELRRINREEELDLVVIQYKRIGDFRDAVVKALMDKVVEEVDEAIATGEIDGLPAPEEGKDVFGCRLGSISAIVNEAILQWDGQFTEQDVVDHTGLTLDQVRGRLYHMAATEQLNRVESRPYFFDEDQITRLRER